MGLLGLFSVFVKSVVCVWIYLCILLGVYASEGLYQEKVEIKRIEEELDASFHRILGSLTSQTSSDPRFALGQEGQIWARYNYCP